MLFGFACIAMARWSRSRGSNALVLMQREEALKAEQDRQKVLAANLERNRIGTAMQTEVLTTLESVIAQADEGLVMLNAEPAPDSDADRSRRLRSIGARGRAASGSYAAAADECCVKPGSATRPMKAHSRTCSCDRRLRLYSQMQTRGNRIPQ
ncbi:MAG: hypothetical protein ACLVG8_02325 [Bifidobacterium longum]